MEDVWVKPVTVALTLRGLGTTVGVSMVGPRVACTWYTIQCLAALPLPRPGST